MEPRIDKLLATLGHRDRLRAVRLLLDGPMREDDLRKELGIGQASTVTRHLDRLDAERLIGQDEQRGTRYVHLPRETRVLVQAAADLAAALSQAQAGADRGYARDLRKEGFTVDADHGAAQRDAPSGGLS